MHTKIKVKDLSLVQWDWIQTHLVRDYEFTPETVRVCVEFELTPDFNLTRVELPVRAFMHLMNQLQGIETRARAAEAALAPDALSDHLEDQRNAADPVRAAERAGEYQTGQGHGAGWND